MSFVTIIWSMAASACMTLALVHACIWLKQRQKPAHLVFAILAVSVAALAVCELRIMFSQTPGEYARWGRWTQLPIFVAVVATVGFLWFELGTGRVWLACAVCAARSVALVLNFAISPNLNFNHISSLQSVSYLGQTVSVAQGEVSDRRRIGELASLLLLTFAADASISLWRRGSREDRRRALLVGGSVILFVLVGAGSSFLIHAGTLRAPYMASLAFMIPVVAMAYQLGAGLARAGQLERDLDTSRAELRESEQQLEQVVRAAEMGVWRWDAGRGKLWISPKGRELLNLNGKDTLTLNEFFDAIDPEDREHLRSAVTESFQTGSDYDREARVRLPDGRTRWIAARGRAQGNDHPMGPFMGGVCFDITRRRQAEDRFRLVVEAAPSAMVMIGPDGRIGLVNRRAESLFGYSRDELLGHGMDSLIPERFRSLQSSQFRSALELPESGGLVPPVEVAARRKDGTEVPIEIGLSPIQCGDQRFVLASVVDLSQRRQVEQEQALHRNELAHLSRVAMMGELSGSFAHELNQPLTAILSNAQAAQALLSEGAASLNDLPAILQDIVQEDRRAREIISRLRLLFQKGEVQYEPLELNSLTMEVLRLMNSELINHGVTVRTAFQPGLPIVRGDRVHLQQVLINLLVNASDSMSRNEMHDRKVSVLTTVIPEGAVRLSVADTGCGIPTEQIETIFEPFHTTKSKGLGLGLAVCRTIVSAHGGSLVAVNNSDRGACFHLTLPRGTQEGTT